MPPDPPRWTANTVFAAEKICLYIIIIYIIIIYVLCIFMLVSLECNKNYLEAILICTKVEFCDGSDDRSTSDNNEEAGTQHEDAVSA